MTGKNQREDGFRHFPCPLCTHPLDVRRSKKGKPYVVCDPCGVQLFVRGPDGVGRFNALVAAGESGHAFDRLAEMERRYSKRCPKCGKTFWITEKSIATDWFHGEFTGYHCPDEKCDGVVKPQGVKR